MALTVTKVLNPVVSVAGGDVVYVLGTFTPGVAYQVLMGGVLSASGTPGQPYTVYTGDGVSLQCYAASVPLGPAVALVVQDNAGNSATLPAAITCQPPFYASQTFSFRSILPPLYNTGPRSFADLPQVGT